MDVVHLNQKQLAARWHLSEATLERWRSEGLGPKCTDVSQRDATATTLASQITGEMKVRSPQARTDQAVC